MFVSETSKLYCLCTGKMGENVKTEQQDSDGQEEKAPPSPLTPEEWGGPSKILIQPFLTCLTLSQSL